MMQKCSELGKNTMAWQHLLRLGHKKLRVKKGPYGHFLDTTCRDELQSSLPADSFDELMVWVDKWLTRLDEKDRVVRLKVNSHQHPKDTISVDSDEEAEKTRPTRKPADSAVVDLCSDEEDEAKMEQDSFDTESVISTSSLVLLDDELGEINLKDYSDHVDGKLDADTIKKRKLREQEQTSFRANKQTTMKKFLTPKKSSRSFAKTNSRKSRSLIIGKEKVVTKANGKRGTLILRELNFEEETDSNKEESMEDSDSGQQVIDKLSPGENVQSLTEGKSKPKTLENDSSKPKSPIAREHSQDAIKKKESKPNAMAKKESSPCDKLTYQEIKPKSTPDVLKNTEQNGDTKENSKPNKSIETTVEKKETILSKTEGQTTIIKISGSQRVKITPIRKEALTTTEQPSKCHITPKPNSPGVQERIIHVPTELIRDVIRVRTDLLASAEPLNQAVAQVDGIPPADIPAGSAEKRKLTPEPAVNQARSSSEDLHAQPKRPAQDTSIPAAVPTSRCPVNISAAPSCTFSYPNNIPAIAAPVASSNCQPMASCQPRSNLGYSTGYSAEGLTAGAGPPANVSYRPILPIANGSASNFTYSTPRYSVAPAPSASASYQPVVSAVPASVRYPPSISVAPASIYQSNHPVASSNSQGPQVTSSNYQSVMPAAPASGYSRYPPPISAPSSAIRPPIHQPSYAPAPLVIRIRTPLSRPPSIPVAPAPAVPVSNQPTGRDPRADLANILGMLAQVELFAYCQKNQEAFHLANQLKISLQRGAVNNSQAPSQNG